MLPEVVIHYFAIYQFGANFAIVVINKELRVFPSSLVRQNRRQDSQNAVNYPVHNSFDARLLEALSVTKVWICYTLMSVNQKDFDNNATGEKQLHRIRVLKTPMYRACNRLFWSTDSVNFVRDFALHIAVCHHLWVPRAERSSWAINSLFSQKILSSLPSKVQKVSNLTLLTWLKTFLKTFLFYISAWVLTRTCA